MVSKWSSEDVVKFLDVYEDNSRNRQFDAPSDSLRAIQFVHLRPRFLLFPLTISLSSSLKTKIAPSVTSSVAFSHVVRK